MIEQREFVYNGTDDLISRVILRNGSALADLSAYQSFNLALKNLETDFVTNVAWADTGLVDPVFSTSTTRYKDLSTEALNMKLGGLALAVGEYDAVLTGTAADLVYRLGSFSVIVE